MFFWKKRIFLKNKVSFSGLQKQGGGRGREAAMAAKPRKMGLFLENVIFGIKKKKQKAPAALGQPEENGFGQKYHF